MKVSSCKKEKVIEKYIDRFKKKFLKNNLAHFYYNLIRNKLFFI